MLHLLENGANINMKNGNGQTPLFSAAENYFRDVAHVSGAGSQGAWPKWAWPQGAWSWGRGRGGVAAWCGRRGRDRQGRDYRGRCQSWRGHGGMTTGAWPQEA